jgi:hypothetical protein
MVSKTGNVNQGIPYFQVGDVNFKVEGGDPAKPVCKTKPYFTFTFTFSFLKTKSGGGSGVMQLDGQFAWCPTAVECPG